MRFSSDFTVDAPADELFAFVSDVERVAPCLPGARIDGSDGDQYRGSMLVKVGPITADYRGTLRVLELDAGARRAVLRARADEAKGQGQAEARIATAVEDVEGASRIRIDTDLQIRGRVAQFARGAMEKIADRTFAEFARNIEAAIASDGREAPVGPGAERRPPAAQPAGAPSAAPARPLDAVGLLAGPRAERALRLGAAALIGFGYGYLVGRLRERSR
jgi:carbon monoxide dehydrogenase subunit G